MNIWKNNFIYLFIYLDINIKLIVINKKSN